ncbi:hypothetical protein MPLDJ20_220025 [Mesorhizobium plurifarium]|uniref:Uncharacterized protein n=1 Tax=Mesorhizobium plurifarium TaxID=69974 RepID=A0A090F2D8_MESPL|nr:hypothetical protein MPLDJ20_220025 [Mesorhizobium plurifarium]
MPLVSNLGMHSSTVEELRMPKRGRLTMRQLSYASPERGRHKRSRHYHPAWDCGGTVQAQTSPT